MRTMLYEAAQAMMRSKKWSWFKAWAMQIARRRGMKKAIVALARRLAVTARSRDWSPRVRISPLCPNHKVKSDGFEKQGVGLTKTARLWGWPALRSA
jgi:hypothetical protein